MNKTLMRILSIALLMMVSIGAWAQEKYVTVNLGANNDGKFDNGTIVEAGQEREGDAVTVTLTVTPATGYTFNKNNVTIYATLSSFSGTRTPEISKTLTLDGPTGDVTKATDYTVTVDANLGVWVESATFNKVSSPQKGPQNAGPDPYVGTWYITNGSNYYLVPAGGCYQDNENTPYLTTFQTAQDKNSIWRIEKVEDGDDTYYRFIHNATGKYLTANDYVLNATDYDNKGYAYLRLHLETFDTPTDATLFIIVKHTNNKLAIRSKDYYAPNIPISNTNTETADYYWLDISGGNVANYWSGNYKGALGFYYANPITSNNAAPWTFVSANQTCATPVIAYNEGDGDGTFTISYPIASDDVTIHYTTDGTEPTSSSTSYSTAFSATGVKMVRAIAVKTGYDNSAEAELYSPLVPHLFKTIDAANLSYYLISPTDDNDATEARQCVTTSNVPNPRMQWILKSTGLIGGVQYYYIVNGETNKYLYCKGIMNQGDVLRVKTLGEEGTEADRFIFRLWKGDGYYFISPKIYSYETPTQNKNNMLRKQNATDHTNQIGLYQYNNDLARWQIVDVPADPKSLSELPAEMVSTESNSVYFKLRNAAQANSTDYFVYPPASTAYATAATTGTNPEWYFVEATDADTWNTYYNIRNAQTGDYLYFNSTTAYNDNGNKFLTSSAITSGNEDMYKFLVLKTANTTYSGTYHIVPKAIRNNNNQANIALNRDGTTLKTRASRNSANSCWFFDATTFTCDAPTFSYDAVQGVLSMASPNNAPIYYVGWNDGDSEPSLTTPTDGTLYTDPIDVNYTHYKAIAARCTDGSDKSSAATYDLAASFQCATPVISFNSSTKKVSIASATASATIYYIVGDGTFSESATDYGGTVYTSPFNLTAPETVKAIAVRDGVWSTASVVAEWNEAPHYIDKASEMTNMNFYYVANEGFEADVTIGTLSDPFTGTFDGAYTSFSLSSSLFGYVDGATIKNVRVSSASVSGTGHKGALVNEATGASRIYNCGVLDGSVTSSDAAAGGLVGHIASGSNVRVVNCYNYATISGGTHAAGIVGWNEGTVDGTTTVSGTGVRIANCMMYGDITSGTVISPVYCGNHTNNQQKLTEYNFYRSRANLTYTAYNDQLAIGSDENLYRFPFYRHILNTHRELAAYFLFADHTDKHVLEIGHWVLDTDIAPYPIVEPWETNTRRTTVDIAANLPNTTEKFAGKLLNGIGSDGYYTGDGTLVTAMGSSGYLAVTVKIGSQTYNASLPITDMNESRYDYTWGKVVLPHANEFSGWTRDYDYICTGWKITSVTKDGSALTTFNIPSSEPYNFVDRGNAQKDIYNATSNPYVFAQGGNYIVPYGVTAITIEAHFAKAFYLSDPYADVGYQASDYKGATNLGWQVPTTYHGKPVYTSLSTLVGQLSNATNPNDQAIVLVGNYHYRVTDANSVYLNTGRAVTIMSCDEDNNQEPDYAWYMGNTHGRLNLPPLRFDLPIIELGMAARVNSSSYYPGVGIWLTRGWFELTENAVNNSSQFEINSSAFTKTDNGYGNNRWIANSGRFVQIVRAREGDCTKLSYIQIGGNAYIQELYPGSHTDNARTSATVPILLTGGEVLECYMTGYKAGATLSGDMIYFWGAGGKIDKWLGSYLENPSAAGVTAKIDHANIIRFFGGGTSAAARVKGDIDITINNSKVDFYCGGPEFGDMYEGKILATHATGTTFGEYYGAGFGGTSITYVRKAQTNQLSITNSRTYDLAFTNYTDNRLGVDATYGIGTCYKFEFIFNSNATQLVTRFYTGYAQFSLATTGNVTNTLSHCVIEKDFYGAGCQGKVNGTVTSTLTDCEVKGSAFGGGYKATSNEVSVYPTTQPTYSVFTKETGLFSDFGTVEPETYTWIHGDAAGSNTTNKTLTTTTDMSELGNVTDDITLTIDGGSVAENVFGGGNESKSLRDTNVTLMGDANIGQNVFGGGNKADVEGSATVNIQE